MRSAGLAPRTCAALIAELEVRLAGPNGQPPNGGCQCADLLRGDELRKFPHVIGLQRKIISALKSALSVQVV